MGLACACKSKGLVQGESHMKTRWEKAIKKGDSSVGSGSGLDSKIEAMQRTQRANFDALDNVNTLKQQSNNTQCAVMHSGLWSKKTH